jgi:hypothetical protein
MPSPPPDIPTIKAGNARARRLRNALPPTSTEQWERVEMARKLRERW